MTVLLIDDEKPQHDLFGLAVKQLRIGANLVTVTGCDEALHGFRKLSFLPDYIFLDLDMPVVDGYACFKMIRSEKILNKIPVVIYCSGRPELVKTLLRRGAHCHLDKSVNFVKFCGDLGLILKPKPAVGR